MSEKETAMEELHEEARKFMLYSKECDRRRELEKRVAFLEKQLEFYEKDAEPL